MNIVIKRAYDEAAAVTATERFVDRLYTGRQKENLKVDEWCKKLRQAPEELHANGLRTTRQSSVNLKSYEAGYAKQPS